MRYIGKAYALERYYFLGFSKSPIEVMAFLRWPADFCLLAFLSR
jgi:hypothetical protein